MTLAPPKGRASRRAELERRRIDTDDKATYFATRVLTQERSRARMAISSYRARHRPLATTMLIITTQLTTMLAFTARINLTGQ